jgi:8-oxo-dGTP pyrophosphatase MutT (NUDIX family)
MGIGRFFAAVAALIWRPVDGKYLVLRRSPDKDFAGGAWECITGRVDQGEGFTEAVRREVNEELGAAVRIDFIVGTFHLYRGEEKPENEIVGIQYCCTMETPGEIETSWEHCEVRWITAEEAKAMLPAGHWLREAIRRAEAIRALTPPELLTFYRGEGFEL